MTRVFIYGSCVTRDSEPWFKDFGLEKVGYVARQSLISSYRKADVSEYDLSVIKSNFQRRMTKGDIAGNLRGEIRRAEPDVIFWDICDERLGVKKAPSGGMITHSRDHVAERIHPGPFGKIVQFGEDSHFELWQRGLQELQSALESYGLKEHIYLNATPWASVDEFGNNHNGQAESAKRFNSKAVRYLDWARSQGVTVVELEQSHSVSRTNGHQWGPAAFHYIDETYISMLDALTSSIQGAHRAL